MRCCLHLLNSYIKNLLCLKDTGGSLKEHPMAKAGKIYLNYKIDHKVLNSNPKKKNEFILIN